MNNPHKGARLTVYSREQIVARIQFALNNTHVIDFAMKQGGFSGYGLQGFV